MLSRLAWPGVSSSSATSAEAIQDARPYEIELRTADPNRRRSSNPYKVGVSPRARFII